MSLIFKSMVCLIGAAALFTGCSKEHGVLSADDASLKKELFSISGFASLIPNSNYALSKVSETLPTEVIKALEESKYPKIALVWSDRNEVGDISVDDQISPFCVATKTTWPLNFNIRCFDAPSQFADYGDISLNNTSFKNKIALATIWLFNDTQNDNYVDLHIKPDTSTIRTEQYFYLRQPNKDWLLGIAKYHFVVYVADSQVASAYNHWADSLIHAKNVNEGDEVWTNLKPGYNLMEAVNVRDTVFQQGTPYEQKRQTYDYFKAVPSTIPIEIEFRTNGTSYSGGVVGY
ncbi:MAG: hypothetical protein JNL74_13220 [Fibrobacteres bacterium]|nr:hypothetical protein [Fibrobacterota bacterium]